MPFCPTFSTLRVCILCISGSLCVESTHGRRVDHLPDILALKQPLEDDVGALLQLSLPSLSAVGDWRTEVVCVNTYTAGRLRLLEVKSEFKK